MERFPNPERHRLKPRNAEVLAIMRNGEWLTLEAVAKKCGMRNASTCASRLRDIKAETEWTYERRGTKTRGVFEYRLFIPAGNSLQLELEELHA